MKKDSEKIRGKAAAKFALAVVLFIIGIFLRTYSTDMKDDYRYFFDDEYEETIDFAETAGLLLLLGSAYYVCAAVINLWEASEAEKKESDPYLAPCPHCNQYISKDAASCPYCGREIAEGMGGDEPWRDLRDQVVQEASPQQTRSSGETNGVVPVQIGSKVQCPECRTLQADSTCCYKCGAKFVKRVAIPVQIGNKIQCPECDTILRSDRTCCYVCGTEFRKTKEPAVKQPQAPIQAGAVTPVQVGFRVQCPKCNVFQPKGRSSCENCGVKFSGSEGSADRQKPLSGDLAAPQEFTARQKPLAAAPMEQEAIVISQKAERPLFCSHCGKPLEKDAVFCGYCGRAL